MEENAYVNTQTAQLRNVIALLTGVERAENRPSGGRYDTHCPPPQIWRNRRK